MISSADFLAAVVSLATVVSAIFTVLAYFRPRQETRREPALIAAGGDAGDPNQPDRLADGQRVELEGSSQRLEERMTVQIALQEATLDVLRGIMGVLEGQMAPTTANPPETDGQGPSS